MAAWQLQNAENRFSAVADAALSGEPQRTTRRGRPAAVVLAEAEYRRLRNVEAGNASNFVEHLLAIPDPFEIATRSSQ